MGGEEPLPSNWVVQELTVGKVDWLGTGRFDDLKLKLL